jgi:hypothetical protein
MYGYTHLIYPIDNDIDNQTYLLNLIVEAKENAKAKINNNKERFISPVNENLLLESDAQNYLISLNNIDNWIQNEYNGSDGIKQYIKGLVKNAANNRAENKQLILDTLTNIYIISYLDSLNRQNAETYKVYLKYKDPKNNKYYAQYLK